MQTTPSARHLTLFLAKTPAYRESKKVIYAALFAELAIAACKYIAAALSGSSAIFAEAVHSTIDTGNELLLLLGIRCSQRPADALHPYGHRKVLYFYSVSVAIYMFGLGGMLTIYEGSSSAEGLTSKNLNRQLTALKSRFAMPSRRSPGSSLRRTRSERPHSKGRALSGISDFGANS